MKLLIVSMFLYSLSSYSIECGPAPKVTKNRISTYLECAKGESDCLELKDEKGVFEKLNRNSKIDFEVTDATYASGTALFTLATTSACWLEKRTSENIGKKMAIVANDKILTMPMIAAKIAGDKVQITTINNSLCKEIYPGCKEKAETSESAQKENMYDFDNMTAEEINREYGTIMESSMWMTTKRSLVVYKDKNLKSGIVTPLPIFASGKDKGKVFFLGMQEFDKKSKQFIHTKNAVLIATYGWIKREDLAPLNVVRKRPAPENFFMVHFFIKKCEKEIKAFNEKSQVKIPIESLQGQEEIYRDSAVALEAKNRGQDSVTLINEIRNNVNKKSCADLMMGK